MIKDDTEAEGYDEKQIAALTRMLDVGDAEEITEAFQAAMYFIPRKDLRPHEVQYLDTVLSKIESGDRRYNREAIGLVNRTKAKIEWPAGDVDYDRMCDVLEKVASYDRAFVEVRKLALTHIFESANAKITMKTVQTVSAAFETYDPKREDRFDVFAVDKALEIARGYIHVDPETREPESELVGVILQNILDGKLSMRKAYAFVKAAANQYGRGSSEKILDAVSQAQGLPDEVTKLALHTLAKGKTVPTGTAPAES